MAWMLTRLMPTRRAWGIAHETAVWSSAGGLRAQRRALREVAADQAGAAVPAAAAPADGAGYIAAMRRLYWSQTEPNSLAIDFLGQIPWGT